MPGYVRVTLTRPYYDSPAPDGTKPEDRDVTMRFGTEEAQTVRNATGNETFDVQNPDVVKPGAPIVFRMNYGKKESTVMPIDAAKHWFGDWDKPKVSPPGRALEREETWPHERFLVAQRWGGYVTAQPVNPRDEIECRSLPIIAPPRVPHVKIEILDAGTMQPTSRVIDPWEHFAWEDQVNVSAAAKSASATVLPANENELQRLIAAEVAKALTGVKK